MSENPYLHLEQFDAQLQRARTDAALERDGEPVPEREPVIPPHVYEQRSARTRAGGGSRIGARTEDVPFTFLLTLGGELVTSKSVTVRRLGYFVLTVRESLKLARAGWHVARNAR